jgi:hypothetical protein
MNRDERRTRAPALPPTHRVLRGVTVLLPTDGEAGGSWIAVNDFGHTLALLNRWDDTPHEAPGPFISRGLLVVGLAPTAGPAEVFRALGGIQLQLYRPFTLASVAPDEDPRLFEWDGRVLEHVTVTEPGLLRASSGSDQAGAERERGALFREAARRPEGLNEAVLWALHHSHLPEKGPLSICMHRNEAATVSLSLIMVSPSLVRFRYVAGSPCETAESEETVLERSTM